MPRGLSAHLNEEEDRLVLVLPDTHWAMGLFLLVWFAGWTVACVCLIWVVLTQPRAFHLLFGIPFWVSWLFVAGLLVNIFWGRHRLVFDSTGLRHEWRAVIVLSQRQVPLAEVHRFVSRLFDVHSEGVSSSGIEVVTAGRSLAFGTHFEVVERDWLAYRLEVHRRKLQNQARIVDLKEGDLSDSRGSRLPSDSTWTVCDEFPSLVFQQRGRFRWSVVLSLLFVNGFWNGIMGVFVGGMLGLADEQPIGMDWWGHFFFLIPFEILGLAMLLGLLLAVLEPFRVTRWIFGRDEIHHVTTRLGLPLGWRLRYQTNSFLTATVRDDLGSGRFGCKPAYPTGDHYGLQLADSNDREVCSIKSLTLGEARWMKGRLQEHGDCS